MKLQRSLKEDNPRGLRVLSHVITDVIANSIRICFIILTISTVSRDLVTRSIVVCDKWAHVFFQRKSDRQRDDALHVISWPQRPIE